MRQIPLRGPHAKAAGGALPPLRADVVRVRASTAWSTSLLRMALAFIAAFTAVKFVALFIGATRQGIDDALLVAGRLSYALFCPVDTGCAVAPLFGPALGGLTRRAPNCGPGNASAHIVHAGLAARLCYVGSPSTPVVRFLRHHCSVDISSRNHLGRQSRGDDWTTHIAACLLQRPQLHCLGLRGRFSAVPRVRRPDIYSSLSAFRCVCGRRTYSRVCA
jgi:hypothetical protein